jgi:hypothetical protein
MTTPRTKPAPNGDAPAPKPTFRHNAEIDDKIDAHIRENPEHMNWLKGLPRERLERMLILNEVRQIERQQTLKKNILEQVSADPERRKAYEILMKDVPEEQRAELITQLEKRKWRANQSQAQAQTRRETPAVRV